MSSVSGTMDGKTAAATTAAQLLRHMYMVDGRLTWLFRVRSFLQAVKRLAYRLTAWALGPIPLFQQSPNSFLSGAKRWHGVVAALLGCRVALGVVMSRSLFGFGFGKRHRRMRAQVKHLRQKMEEAETYEAWYEAATALDSVQGRRVPAHLLDERLSAFERMATSLQKLREAGDVHGLIWSLRQDSSRSVGAALGEAAEGGYVRCLEPPPPVVRYLEETQAALHEVCRCDALSIQDRIAFVKELRHSYGRTGLVLSGGGSFGHFHFGVSRALLHAGLLPRVFSGSSAGSIGCALLCTRTDAELAQTMDDWVECNDNDFFGAPKTAGSMLRHLFTRGTLHAAEEYVIRLQRLFGDLTFQEAYARSGRVLNVAVVAFDTKEPCRLLNYLTAPNVIVWSAVACSSAFPFLFAPQKLLYKDTSGRIVDTTIIEDASIASTSGGLVNGINGSHTIIHHKRPNAGYPKQGASGGDPCGPTCLRRWCDGSLEEDLPMRGLGEMFNVNYFLASQANPWLVPVLAAQHKLPLSLQKLLEWELKHRAGQLLKIWPHNKLFKLLCQPWRGDITFVLPLSTFPVLRSATNFTPKEILTAMKEGQRAVWSKLPAIRAACTIEVAIDAELKSLTLRSRAAARSTLGYPGSKFPSWLNMKCLGIPSSAESLDQLPDNDGDGGLEAIQETALGDVGEGTAARLEGGMDAWKDVTALALGLDVIAP